MKEILDFLNSIEGEGYGGMASFEAARSLARDPWRLIDNAPKDGTHILACRIPLGIRVTVQTNPPTVVHWFDDPEQPGFYTSVNERAPDHPFEATHWQPLDPLPILRKGN